MNIRVLLNAALVVGALAVTGCAASPPVAASQSVPLGVDLGASKQMASGPNLADPSMQAPREGNGRAAVRPARAERSDLHASGVINSLNPRRHTVNISHRAIPAIGWPPMTMDFGVAPSINLDAFAPGTRVDFTLRKACDGMYQIQSLQPAKQER